MDDFDLQIDDILANNVKTKKKVNGKKKGNRVELKLCKVLTEHFDEEFSRSVGSGNRWSQVNNMPSHAKQTFAGDICVPEKFKWVIECKGGYEDNMNLTNICDGKLSCLDDFIEQVCSDAEYSDRKPILCWKRNRKPWIAVIKWSDSNELITRKDHHMSYGDWVIVSLDLLLEKTNKEFWYGEE